MSIKRVRFALRTHNELLEKSHRLTRLVDRFNLEPDSWMDNALLNDILSLARDCGDTRYNSLVPQKTEFEVTSFWTRHFDGLYVFHDADDEVVVIGDQSTSEKFSDQDSDNDHRFIGLSDEEAIYDYLVETGRLEAMNPSWLEQSDILQQRIEVCTRMALSKDQPDTDLIWIGDVATNNWVHRNLDKLERNPAFSFLTRLRKSIQNGHIINPDNYSAKEKLMAVRAEPGHPDYLLVNRFLTEFVPFDFLTRFIVNKLAFYRDYEDYNDAQRNYVVHTIKHRYFPDKQAMWERLFEQRP